ncbi:hypothetical protein E3P77_03273 [Wallemia ichthyophaga]|uniref:Altered inheritance of mitochondria protein 32 n=1 Tax=Wallemia ichthyophaga TaxID=245174 RepID=A0A4T0G5Z7_WALIC|nr:hypothetical protein E3P95_03120 [Wallemia ichthyophaga]TIA98094.1 hypothetical protein E3P94_03080 [Wallemia ichthyophaga]TIB08614.1 hypothetical protein E3P93_03451 [Wallemia ichthyophaga]TIB09878.1 hypothetical protein E3P90_03086 [Wallemia ichthyophaga]TIB20691.1 hypothetical protein E3P89_03065 [Wallemia ichthyophaga]
MSAFLKRTISGMGGVNKPTNKPADNNANSLSTVHVPVSDVDCHSCTAPCDQIGDFEDLPKNFDVDLTSNMLGSYKPFSKQVVLSTGKTDWEHDITDNELTLAGMLDRTQDTFKLKDDPGLMQRIIAKRTAQQTQKVQQSTNNTSKCEGVFDTRTDGNGTIQILNGSHISPSTKKDRESALVFPDYVLAENICVNRETAEDFFKSHLAVNHLVASEKSIRTYPLPYIATVLICSHKSRDKKCAISAPIIEREMIKCIEAEGWSIDKRGDSISLDHKPVQLPQGGFSMSATPYTSPKIKISPEETDTTKDVNEISERLRDVNVEEGSTVGLFKVSHVGGHKFAGNVIIHFPTGASICYGRVSAREVPAIVQQTIKHGKVLPELLRGGGNISRRDKNKSLREFN